MKNIRKFGRYFIVLFAVIIFSAIFTTAVSADQAEDTSSVSVTEEEQQTEQDGVKAKAIAAAAVIGVVAAAGAIGMSIAISKSVEGIARQPEADGKIRTSLMLGLVFVETAIIYALIIAVLIIFVL